MSKLHKQKQSIHPFKQFISNESSGVGDIGDVNGETPSDVIFQAKQS